MSTSPIIACIPVRLHPADPTGGNCTYTISQCDRCNEQIWLGTRSAELVKHGVQKVCAVCLILTGEYSAMDTLKRLDETDA